MKFIKMNRSCFTTAHFPVLERTHGFGASQRIFRPVSTGPERRLDLTISVVMDFFVRTWQFIRNLLRRMVP